MRRPQKALGLGGEPTFVECLEQRIFFVQLMANTPRLEKGRLDRRSARSKGAIEAFKRRGSGLSCFHQDYLAGHVVLRIFVPPKTP